MRARLIRRLLLSASLGLFWLVSVSTVRPAAAAQRANVGVELPLRYLHQYLGNASDNYDCGPAAVAMVLDYFGTRPAGWSDATFVAAIRRGMRLPPAAGTWYRDLDLIFHGEGFQTYRIPNQLAGAPVPQLQMMQRAIAAGAPVIAMVHGATLGRGAQYNDHWVVVAGFGGDDVHLLDPDDQPPRLPGWIRGGDIRLPLAVFGEALREAQPGPYGLIILPPAGFHPQATTPPQTQPAPSLAPASPPSQPAPAAPPAPQVVQPGSAPSPSNADRGTWVRSPHPVLSR